MLLFGARLTGSPRLCLQTSWRALPCEFRARHECRKRTPQTRPNAGILAWHAAQDPAHLFLTTITLAELWQGFHALSSEHPDYTGIRRFVSEIPRLYRVLNFDRRAARIWGELTARATGPLPLRDSLIAAVALSRGYRVVSRDTAPFSRAGCKIVAPWT